MTIIPEGHAECALRLQLSGFSRPSFITWGMKSAFTSADELAEFCFDQVMLGTSIKLLFPAVVQLTEIVVRLGTASGEPIVGSDVRNAAGVGNISPPPPNVALLVHKRTARGGRRGRGRMFFPWALSEGAVGANGTMDLDQILGRQDAVNQWLNGLGTEGNNMVLLHSTGATTPGPPNAVTSLVIDPVVATQRRRLGR